MSNDPGNAHYVGFKADDALVKSLQQFIQSVEQKHKSAGQAYVDFMEALTRHITNTLLIEMVEIAEISKVGQKVVNVCVSSSNKVSGMLTAKIYKKRSVQELEPVAALWKTRLQQVATERGAEWYLVAPIDEEFGAALDAIRHEKGENEHFAPSELDGVMSKYDRLSKAIIELYFLEATRLVDMGSITKTMLTTGVSTVEKAVESVFDKVIRPLEPLHFGRFVDHIHQFHVRT